MRPITFSLSALVPREELEDFLKRQSPLPDSLAMGLLDDKGNPIFADSVDAYRICPKVTNQQTGWCVQCPVRNSRSAEGAGQATCHAHILTTIAPVQIDGESCIYVVHQHPKEEFFGIHGWDTALPEAVRAHLRGRRGQPLPGLDNARKLVTQTATKLANWVKIERRWIILRKAVDDLVNTTRTTEIAKILIWAIEMLLGNEVSICLYFQQLDGALRLVEETGEEEKAGIPDPLPFVQQGHVGNVIRTGQPKYAPNLIADPQGYVFDTTVQPACSLTLPLRWRDGRPAALQILSKKINAVERADQRALERLAKIAGEMASKLFFEERYRLAEDLNRPENWSDVLIELALNASVTLEDILLSRQRLYDAFCSEIKYITGANYTSIRLRDLDGMLRFTSCYPPDKWTREKKCKAYTPTEKSTGNNALSSRRPVYLRDVHAPDVEYVEIHSDVKSLYTVPFEIKGETRGVVSVDWDKLDAGWDPILRLIDKLVAELEQVLKTLARREDELFRQFEDAFRVSKDIRAVGKLLVDNVKNIFRAGACSLYLIPEGEDRLIQAASTAPPKIGEPSYRVGEGLTGFVAKELRTLLIRDTRDANELQAISSNLRHSNKFPEDVDYPRATTLAFLAAPLIVESRAIGVIRLTLKHAAEGLPNEFTHEEEGLLLEIAGRIAQSVSTMWRADSADKGYKLASASNDLNSAAQALCDEFCHAAQAAGAFMCLWDRTTNETTEAATGLLRILLAERCPKPTEGKQEYSESNALETTLGNDVDRWLETPLGKAHGIQSAARIVLPLTSQPNFGGYVSLIWRSEQIFLDGFKLELDTRAARYAQALTPILEQRRTAALLGRKVAEIGGIRDAGRELGLTKNFGRLRERLLDLIVQESGAEKGAMRLFEPNRRVWRRVAPEVTDDQTLPLEVADDELLERSVNKREFYYVDHVDTDKLWIEFKRRAEGTGEDPSRIRASLHIPLIIGDNVRGLILLEGKQPFSRDKADHLTILATFAAVAQVFVEEQQGDRTLKFLGQMMSGFLHNINNRLHAAYGWLSVAGKYVHLDDGMKKAHSELQTALDRIDVFSKELSQAALAEKVELAEKIDLDALVREVVAEFEQHEDRKAEIEISTQLYTSCQVAGSSVLLKTAFRLVLQNALEAITGQGRIHISSERVEIRRVVRVSVKDSGIGMTDEVKAHCFDFFYTTKEGKGGTGMGLPVVFGLISRHGGVLLAPESAPGRGCTITIELPFIEGERA